MTIAEYIKWKKLTRAQFAELVGVVYQAVGHWITRERFPCPAKAAKIVKVTKGKVKLTDIYDEYLNPRDS